MKDKKQNNNRQVYEPRIWAAIITKVDHDVAETRPRGVVKEGNVGVDKRIRI